MLLSTSNGPKLLPTCFEPPSSIFPTLSTFHHSPYSRRSLSMVVRIMSLSTRTYPITSSPWYHLARAFLLHPFFIVLYLPGLATPYSSFPFTPPSPHLCLVLQSIHIVTIPRIEPWKLLNFLLNAF